MGHGSRNGRCGCGFARRQAVKTQPGGRCIGGQGTQRVQPPHFQGTHALAQGGFQGVFPAGLDVQALPQRGQPVQTLTGKPGAQLAAGLDFVLQGAQGFKPGRQLGQRGGLGIHGLLALAALVVQIGGLGLPVFQPGRRFGLGLGGGFQLRLQGLQPRGIVHTQGLAVGAQAVAALVELAALFIQAALLGGQHANGLLHAHHGLALGVGLRLGLAVCVFVRGQLGGLVFDLRGQNLGLLFGIHALPAQGFQLVLGLLLAVRPLECLLLQLRQPQLHPAAAFHHIADFGLQLAHFGGGGVQRPLGLGDGFVGRMVALAQGFQLGLGAAQIGHAPFQLGEQAQALHADAGLLGLGLRPLQKPELLLPEGGACQQVFVLNGHRRLLVQPLQVGIEFAQDVFHPQQVVAGVVQAVGGFAAALFVLGHTRRFFQKQAQFFRAAFDDAADGALADDGVGPWPQAGAQKHILHIAAAHQLVVDEVAAGAVAGQHALDGHLGKLAPLATGTVVIVVEHQLHAGPAGGFAGSGAAEDHVLHGLAAQLAGLAFAQHPAHRIHDVGLAAAVGAHYAHQLPGQLEMRGFGKRLEAGEFDGVEAHRIKRKLNEREWCEHRARHPHSHVPAY